MIESILLVTVFCGLIFLNVRFWAAGGINVHHPGLHGKVIVITGSNTGLGFQTAKELAKLSPKVIIMACRDSGRALNAIEQIKVEVKGANLIFMELDLNDLASVKKFAQQFNKNYEKLDLLINNAGIMALPKRLVTAQNFEKQFGVNHMGHFLLTKLLLEKIKKSDEARIVNLSSRAHMRGSFNFDDLHREKAYSAWPAYSQSKLANVYFTRQMDKILRKDGVQNVKVVSLHPGVVRTELARYMFEGNPLLAAFAQVICGPCVFMATKNSLQGAQTPLHCSLVDFDKLESGKYYSDCAVLAETMPNDDWESEAEKLWELSEKAVKAYIL